jgi:CHASE3 domain sensor protein
VRRRMSWLVVIAVVLALGSLGVALYAGARSRSAISTWNHGIEPVESSAAFLSAAYAGQQSGLRGYLITNDPAYLDSYQTATAAIPGYQASATASSRDLGRIPGLLRQLIAAHQRWQTMVAGPELAAMRAGDRARAQAIETSPAGRLFSDIDRLSRAIRGEITIQRRAAIHANARAQTILMAALITAVVTILLVAAATTAAFWRLVFRPIRMVLDSVRTVASGNYTHRVRASGPTELAELGRGVEAMRLRLVEALDQQGPSVVALRAALAPAPVRTSDPRGSGWEIAGQLIPAEGLLAGDWFDTFTLAGGELGLVVGDVSGHGSPAGVHALRLKYLLRAALACGAEPAEAIRESVNALGDVGEMFATVFIAILDPASGLVRYTNAGHPGPLHLTPSGRPQPRAQTRPETAIDVVTLPPTGPLVASLFDGGHMWETATLRLGPDDLLVCYTDGLTEARDARREQFGMTRLRAAARRSAGERPTVLLERLFAAVAAFATGRATDDRTGVVLARSPRGVIPDQERAGAVSPGREV